jgi:hypothetical protein
MIGSKYMLITPPKGQSELENFAGKFEYENTASGAIKILGTWEKDNIVLLTLPIINPRSKKNFKLQCHTKIKNIVTEIFKEYVDRKYDQTYPILDIGGYVPRHKLWNVRKGLSIHSYGLAIDLNSATNPVGSTGDMPDYVISLFKSYHFTWGGDWTSPKDPMHFEFFVE